MRTGFDITADFVTAVVAKKTRLLFHYADLDSGLAFGLSPLSPVFTEAAGHFPVSEAEGQLAQEDAAFSDLWDTDFDDLPLSVT